MGVLKPSSSLLPSSYTTTTARRDSSKPLPLKQRTSSQDCRRDYSHSTWYTLLELIKVREYLITVDNFSLWRRHLAWAKNDGEDLRGYMTQRYASNMVFLSLLLSTELSVLFNSAHVTTEVRMSLLEGNHHTLGFWAGMMVLLSAVLTILSLVSTFTAWAMVNAVNPINAHCIFRSSIGQYAAELPGRCIVGSIYSFLLSFFLYLFLLLPFGIWSLTLLLVSTGLLVHIVSVFSAFGRVILHTGAMGTTRIFTPEFEECLLPHSLHHNLFLKAKANLAHKTSIKRQYGHGGPTQEPIHRPFSTYDELHEHLSCGDRNKDKDAMFFPQRTRADSTVRFADEATTNGKQTLASTPGIPTFRRSLPSPLSSTKSSSSRDSPTGSVSSLEQWLQQASPASDGSDSNNTKKALPLPLYDASTIATSRSSTLSEEGIVVTTTTTSPTNRNALPPTPPPRSFSGSASTTKASKKPISLNGATRTSHSARKSHSARPTPVLVRTRSSGENPPSASAPIYDLTNPKLKAQYKELSESELFQLDYGDDDFFKQDEKNHKDETTSLLSGTTMTSRTTETSNSNSYYSSVDPSNTTTK